MSRRHLASMSSVGRLYECQAWSIGALPVAPEKPGPPARFGQSVHSLSHWWFMGEPTNVEAAEVENNVVPSDRGRLARVWANLEAWLVENAAAAWVSEIAYALDPAAGTARILGRGIDRKYEEHGGLPHELWGSADIVWTDGETLFVRDIKTGRSPAESHRAQLAGLGLAAWLTPREQYAELLGYPVRSSPVAVDAAVIRANEVGVEELDCVTYEADELRAILAETKRVWCEPSERMVGGPHCTYCPARKHCETGQRALVQLKARAA